MAIDNWTEAVSHGVVLTPGNRPVKISFEYQDGQVLTLKNNALRSWWGEYLSMWALMSRMAAISQAQAAPPPFQPPTLRAEDLHNRQDTKKDEFPRLVPPMKLDDDDEDE